MTDSADGGFIEPEMSPQAVLEKVPLLPEIKLVAELAFELQVRTFQPAGGRRVHLADFEEGGFVERAALFPWGAA